jgi:hypothetical protein
MQINVQLTAAQIATEMASNPDFGAEVLTFFLRTLGRNPGEYFVEPAQFLTCPTIVARELRELADCVERKAQR